MTTFDKTPANAQIPVAKFELPISDESLAEFNTLLRLSKVSPKTFANTRTDKRFGITRDWVTKGKEYWETKYNW